MAILDESDEVVLHETLVIKRLEARILELNQQAQQLEGRIFSLNQQAQQHRERMAKLVARVSESDSQRRAWRDWANQLAQRLGFFSPPDPLLRDFLEWKRNR